MLQEIISHYKRRRTASLLDCHYSVPVAIVGLGTHCLSNIVPILEHLRVPISHILIRSPRTASLASRRFPNTSIVETLSPILNDPRAKAVFLTSPATTHFDLASQILQSGKDLFIEKPPCGTAEELHRLIQISKGALVQVGLQKRYAPAVKILKCQLRHHRPDHYLLRYCTGAYPEGNALSELFIHPIDLAVHLFGPANVQSLTRTPNGTILLLLDHNRTIGTLELSTSYSWRQPIEELSIVSTDGIFHLQGTDHLSFSPLQHSFMGIPLEKILHRHPTSVTLYHHDTFSPMFSNNSLVSAGFYNEIKVFLDALECRRPEQLISLESLMPVYNILEDAKAPNLSMSR